MASMSPTQPGVSTVGRAYDDRVEWLIAVMKKDESTVYKVQLNSRMTGTTALHAIITAYKETKPRVPWYHTHPRLEDATISSFTTTADPEAQDYPRAVIVRSTEPLLELSRAIRRPALLNGTGPALLRDNKHLNVTLGPSEIDGHYHALFFRTEASRWLLAAGVLVSIVVAVVIGFVVGYVTGNGELGVAAGTAAVAVLTLIQGCIVLFR